MFQVPTTVARHGDELALVNARFDLGLPPPFGPGRAAWHGVRRRARQQELTFWEDNDLTRRRDTPLSNGYPARPPTR
jgi:hypothetical protein